MKHQNSHITDINQMVSFLEAIELNLVSEIKKWEERYEISITTLARARNGQRIKADSMMKIFKMIRS